ncbi:GNAT family N-acetyltransferase [Paenibacillus sp. N1-5-1-14]|uniref:GNAT family N-acetyltransferase n=1 Tax=Paenibacillus radicibacter TaxID=2972488 RepID=UPI002158F315|nr:GNAT family N-acetyltransferase [Paenibacillus radicibacter]MCR8646020.1 GNAT family N-acetyltransferase [Paenibacillus radicibacter]
MNLYDVRKSTEADLEALTSLMQQYIVGFYGNAWPSDISIHSLIRTLLHEQSGVQFIAEFKGQPVGFATLYFTFSTMKAQKITVMNDLFVLETYRNSDLEIQLFTACSRYTEEYGFANMTWLTGPGNTRAQQFFEERGARRIEWVNYSLK